MYKDEDCELNLYFFIYYGLSSNNKSKLKAENSNIINSHRPLQNNNV